MIGIFSCAVVAFCQSDHYVLIGRHAFTMSSLSSVTSDSTDASVNTFEDDHCMEELSHILLSNLPDALLTLVHVEPWKQMLTKVACFLYEVHLYLKQRCTAIIE